MLIFLVVFWKWVLNSFFIPDPFKMHHDDGLEDLLFPPSGTTDTSAFLEQNDPLKDSYGMISLTGFISLLQAINVAFHSSQLKWTTRESHV